MNRKYVFDDVPNQWYPETSHFDMYDGRYAGNAPWMSPPEPPLAAATLQPLAAAVAPSKPRKPWIYVIIALVVASVIVIAIYLVWKFVNPDKNQAKSSLSPRQRPSGAAGSPHNNDDSPLIMQTDPDDELFEWDE